MMVTIEVNLWCVHSTLKAVLLSAPILRGQSWILYFSPNLPHPLQEDQDFWRECWEGCPGCENFGAKSQKVGQIRKAGHSFPPVLARWILFI